MLWLRQNLSSVIDSLTIQRVSPRSSSDSLPLQVPLVQKKLGKRPALYWVQTCEILSPRTFGKVRLFLYLKEYLCCISLGSIIYPSLPFFWPFRGTLRIWEMYLVESTIIVIIITVHIHTEFCATVQIVCPLSLRINDLRNSMPSHWNQEISQIRSFSTDVRNHLKQTQHCECCFPDTPSTPKAWK